jgi:conjugal transfer pilus assembly protein TraV
MKNYKLALIAGVTMNMLSACSVLSIGEDEFDCAGKPDGSICKGPMEIYELTNNQDNLDHLMVSREVREARRDHNEEHGHPRGFAHEDGSVKDHDIDEVYKNAELRLVNTDKRQDFNIYEPRSFKRQTANNYEKAVKVKEPNYKNQVPKGELGGLRSTSMYATDLAPEALAVLTPAKVLRILVFPWKDAEQNLHLPGYIYKKLQEEEWVVGNHANLSPTRIIPYKMVKDSLEETQQQERQKDGVDPLNVQRPGYNPLTNKYGQK